MQMQMEQDRLSISGGDKWEPGMPVTHIQLDHEVLNTLCRRGRRRLRDMQTACQALLRLDRVQGILMVAGPPASVEAVRHHLASLGGPRRTVSSAVWAELMRTRTQNSPNAALVRLQSESGCRIHIERSGREVRIFGPAANAQVANRLLDDLEEACAEQRIPLGSARLGVSALHLIASSCCVTIGNDNPQGVTVFGFRSAIASAKEVFDSLTRMADESGDDVEYTPEMIQASGVLANVPNPGVPDSAGGASDRELAESEMARDGLVGIPPPSAPTHALPHDILDRHPPGRHESSRPGAPADRRSNPQDAERQQQMTSRQAHQVCGTCGAAPFCAFCGMPHMRCAEVVLHDQPGGPRRQTWITDDEGGPWTQRQVRLMPFDMQKNTMVQGAIPMQPGMQQQGMAQAIMIPASFVNNMQAYFQPQQPQQPQQTQQTQQTVRVAV